MFSTCLRPAFRRTLILTACAAGVFLLTPAAASAALLATANTVNGDFEYIGIGEHPTESGRGTGHVKIGDCSFDGVNTICVTTGTYTEDAGSSENPGATGTFTLTQTFAGDGLSPALGISTEPGGDFFQFYEIALGAITLEAISSTGDIYSGVFPDDPFENSIGFFIDSDPSTTMCTGVAAGDCRLGLVGLTAGATFSGRISSLVFSFPDALIPPDMSEAPLPAAAPLMLLGLGAMGAMRRKKKAQS